MTDKINIAHALDLSAADGAEAIERSDFYAATAEVEKEGFDCAGTLGTWGTAGGSLGTVGTFGCCC